MDYLKIIVFCFKKKYVSEWEIRSDDLLSHGRMVGRGTYGTVYKAEVRLHGKKRNLICDYYIIQIDD